MTAPLPQFPTDNLYKFMAIFGLVLMLFGQGLPSYVARDLAEKQHELTTKTEDRTRDMILKVADLLAKDTFPNPDQKQSALERASKDMAEFARKAREESAKQSKWYSDYAESLKGYGNTASTVGTFIMLIGFALWYERVQQHQDYILRCEVAKQQKELSAPTK